MTSPTQAELLEIGAQEAATALSRLLRAPVTAEGFTQLEARSLSATHAPRVVVIAFDVSGGVKGTLGLVLDDSVAGWLAGRLTGAASLDGAGGKAALAALAELGNIAASAFLNGAAKRVGKTCLPSVPRVSHGVTADVTAANLPAGTLSTATLRVQQQWLSLVFTSA